MSYSNASRIPFAQTAGIRTVFLNAPMPGVTTPAMVAAVSEAGGLGVIPAADMTPAEICEFGEQVKALTGKPFAVSLAIAPRHTTSAADYTVFADAISMLLEELELPDGTDGVLDGAHDLLGCPLPVFDEQFDAALSLRPRAMISVFGGFREPEAERLEEHGILNIGTATTLREAKVLRAAGCNALIVQGSEAAGPRLSFEDPDDRPVGLFTLMTAAVRATGLPVIAAGGIVSPEQVRGLEAAGASGVMVGTALIGTRESAACKAHRYYAAYGRDVDTVLTRVYRGCLTRVISNALVEALTDYEDKTAGCPGQWALMKPLHRRALELGRTDLAMLPVGQGVGGCAFETTESALMTLTAEGSFFSF